jgi:hypothetical protein
LYSEFIEIIRKGGDMKCMKVLVASIIIMGSTNALARGGESKNKGGDGSYSVTNTSRVASYGAPEIKGISVSVSFGSLAKPGSSTSAATFSTSRTGSSNGGRSGGNNR